MASSSLGTAVESGLKNSLRRNVVFVRTSAVIFIGYRGSPSVKCCRITATTREHSVKFDARLRMVTPRNVRVVTHVLPPPCVTRTLNLTSGHHPQLNRPHLSSSPQSSSLPYRVVNAILQVVGGKPWMRRDHNVYTTYFVLLRCAAA